MTTRRHHAASPSPLAVLTLLCLLLLLDAPAAAAQQQSPSRDKDNGGGAGPAGDRMPGQPPKFSAPMVVLLVALIAAFFFIGFFSVYMRRCGRGASSSGGRRGGIPAAALLVLSRQQEQRNRQEQQQQQRGLDPAVLASFPTMRYADAKELRVVGGGKDAALECAVCLSEFEDDEELRLLPSCSHAFHTDCIGEWLAGHVTCPVCRCNLDPEQEPAAAEAAGEGAGEEQQDRQVAIDVSDDGGPEEEEEERRREEAMELERIGSQRRAVRSRSAAPPVPVPRSHSTGHSLATRLDGDLERFTLRLPEHVRREMVAAAVGEESLRRTGPRERSNPGARSARLGGRSDRWPSFITRTFSSRVPFWSASRRASDLAAEAAVTAGGTTGGGSTTTARIIRREKTGGGASDGSVTPGKGSVRFDCLGVGVAPAVTGARVVAAAGESETEDDEEEKAIVRQREA